MGKARIEFKATLVIGLGALVLAACSADAGGPETTSAPVGTDSESFSSSNHQAIVGDALPFLKASVLSQLQTSDVRTDYPPRTFQSEFHFDNCDFSGGIQTLRDNQASAVAFLNPALNPSAPSASDPSMTNQQQALLGYGESLHAAQDFYSHANWVELHSPGGPNAGEQPLVEPNFGVWNPFVPSPSGGYSTVPGSTIKVIEGTPQSGVVLSGGPSAPGAITVSGSPGLLTGTVIYEKPKACPGHTRTFDAPMHSELNKDDSTPQDLAYILAVQQTEHEWCRLLSLVQATYGASGVAGLCSSWVDNAAAANALCPALPAAALCPG